jgi:hypothetical protein
VKARLYICNKAKKKGCPDENCDCHIPHKLRLICKGGVCYWPDGIVKTKCIPVKEKKP